MLVQSLVVFLSLMFGWQMVVIGLHLPVYILPSPLQVMHAMGHYFSVIAAHTAPTLLEIFLGLGVGVSAGCLVAIFMVCLKPVRFWLMPVLLISQAVPVFAIAPLLVLWFGFGLTSKVLMTMIVLFFPVTSAFYDGMQRLPQSWLDMLATTGASNWRIIRLIKMPAAMPSLATGLRVATALAPVGAIIGEWVGATRGLGYLMLTANARMQIDLLFACLFVIVMISLGLYFLVDWGLKKCVYWRNI